MLVPERSFSRIGCTKRGSSADFCNEAVSRLLLLNHDPKSFALCTLSRSSLPHPLFLQCFDTVGWVIWPVKPVPDMTYNVFGETLSLTQSIFYIFIDSRSYVHSLNVFRNLSTSTSTAPSSAFCYPLWYHAISSFGPSLLYSNLNKTYHHSQRTYTFTPVPLL